MSRQTVVILCDLGGGLDVVVRRVRRRSRRRHQVGRRARELVVAEHHVTVGLLTVVYVTILQDNEYNTNGLFAQSLNGTFSWTGIKMAYIISCGYFKQNIHVLFTTIW